MTYATGALLAFLATLLGSWVVLAALRDRVMDVPNVRSSHTTPTPRGGGIAVALGLAVGLACTQPGSIAILVAFAAALVLGCIGLAEDIRGLSIRTRLGSQLAVGAVASGFIGSQTDTAVWLLTVWLVAGSIWVAGYTNAFNFMDGINGISAFHLVVAGATWLLAGRLDGSSGIEAVGAVTLAAALGFLPWNFPRARFFMGDVGSYLSGAWIAGITMVAVVAQVSVWPLLGVAGVYVADTSYTLLRRIRRGEDWMEAHRSHVYQRIIAAGWSHPRTAVVVAAFSACLTAMGFAMRDASLPTRTGIAGLAVTLVCTYLAMPNVVARMLRNQN